MPRLIDVEVLLEKLEWLDEYDYIVFDAVKRTVDEVPTVEAVPIAELPYTVWLTPDVVQVVRCKDCKYWSNNECIYCYFEDNPNGYCAWGERKE